MCAAPHRISRHSAAIAVRMKIVSVVDILNVLVIICGERARDRLTYVRTNLFALSWGAVDAESG